jgi:hypothetical protein
MPLLWLVGKSRQGTAKTIRDLNRRPVFFWAGCTEAIGVGSRPNASTRSVSDSDSQQDNAASGRYFPDQRTRREVASSRFLASDVVRARPGRISLGIWRFSASRGQPVSNSIIRSFKGFAVTRISRRRRKGRERSSYATTTKMRDRQYRDQMQFKKYQALGTTSLSWNTKNGPLGCPFSILAFHQS